MYIVSKYILTKYAVVTEGYSNFSVENPGRHYFKCVLNVSMNSSRTNQIMYCLIEYNEMNVKSLSVAFPEEIKYTVRRYKENFY